MGYECGKCIEIFFFLHLYFFANTDMEIISSICYLLAVLPL